MFGKNQVLPNENQTDGSSLRIVTGSPFLTIQGEGPFSGHPATFVRLHGCNLRCWFCDTNFDAPDNPVFPIEDIALACLVNQAELIVITGGEPLRQNIMPFCHILHNAGKTIQIETAGTLWLPGLEKLATIVCSPKTPAIHPMIYKHANVFKYVISNGDDHVGYLPITSTQNPNGRSVPLAAPRAGAPVYLSPCDEYDDDKNAVNRRLVAQLAIKYNVIAGVQLHKFLNVD